MNSKEVPGIILKQLGGNKFITMTGAKHFVCDDKALSFKIGRNHKAINYVKIVLTSSDTYIMEFYRISSGIKRGFEKKLISMFNCVYGDQLQSLFTEATGMNTFL